MKTYILEELWKTVEYERVHGYEHRAPKSNKKQTKNRIENTDLEKPLCLIKINSDTGEAMLDKETISNNTIKTVQLVVSNSNSKSNSIHKPNTFDESKYNMK